MDTSLAALTAQPVPIEIGGQVYQFHRFTLAEWGKAQAWCDSRQPCPFASVSRQLGSGKFTRLQEEALLEKAIKLDMAPRPRLGSPECDALLNSDAGIVHLVWLSLSKGDPKFTEARATAVVDRMDRASAMKFKNVIDLGFVVGSDDGGDGGEGEGGPKASTGGGSTTPP